MASRQWSISSKWKFREYNELEHIFKKRLNKSSIYAKRYTSNFYSKIMNTISEFIIFMSENRKERKCSNRSKEKKESKKHRKQ